MNLALFDFDGTLTTRETLPAFIRSAVPPERVRSGALRLAPWVAGYRLGLVSGVAIRARLAAVALRGLSAAEFAAAGERFAREALPALVRPEAMARIDWHRARGDTVAVVSGGFDACLGPWCRAHGLALLCSSAEVERGVLTGRYAGAQCVGEEKVRRVRAHFDLSGFRAVYAYGDTPEDRPMLALADHGWYREMPAA